MLGLSATPTRFVTVLCDARLQRTASLPKSREKRLSFSFPFLLMRAMLDKLRPPTAGGEGGTRCSKVTAFNSLWHLSGRREPKLRGLDHPEPAKRWQSIGSSSGNPSHRILSVFGSSAKCMMGLRLIGRDWCSMLGGSVVCALVDQKPVQK